MNIIYNILVIYKLIKRYCVISVFIFFQIIGNCSPNAGSIDNLSNSTDSTCYYIYQKLVDKKNPDTLIFYSDQLIAESIRYSNWYYECNGYYFKSKAYFFTGEYDKAIDYSFKSLKVAQANSYEKGIGTIYNTLGTIYSTTSDFEKSIYYQKKAINSFKSIPDSVFLSTALFNLGRTYLKLKRNDSALIELNMSLEISNKVNNQSGKAYCLGAIGKAFSFQNKPNEAKLKLNESIKILELIGDYYAISSFFLRMAKIDQDCKNYKSAIAYADSSYNTAKKYGYLTQQRDAAERLFLIYSESCDYKSAFNYQSEYYTLRDSIINEETIRKMADLRTEYEVSQKQAEIDVLNKTRKIQQIIAIGLIIIIILSGTLIIHLFRSTRRQRKLNTMLGEQKEELQAQYEMLDDLNKTKDRFFSIISHDLRGPIGVLKGTTLLIKEYLQTKDYVQLAELTKNMEFSVKKVQNLLDNLLEWALNQQGKFKKVSEKLELNEIIRDVITTHHDIAIAKEIAVKFISAKNELYIYSDANSLMTIVRNLLSNALKFTQRSGLVSISVCDEPGSIILIVEDNGIGMSESKIERLFKIDENKSTWGTEREKGLGIGLNLVNEFVKLNEGSIQVESKPGIGTKFSVRLPVVFADAGNLVEHL
jgi:signal transduction histidine kinase